MPVDGRARMIPPPWLWLALTVWGSFAQTLRNAAQRSLIAELGTLGATLVRFLYGLPFALLWLAVILWFEQREPPVPSVPFFAWVTEAAVAQIAGTAFLLRVMAERNFALGVAYSKSELIQVAVFGFAFLGDPLLPVAVAAICLSMTGVLLLSAAGRDTGLLAMLRGLSSRTGLLGFASGSGFGLAAVGYRGAALSFDSTSFLLAAAYTLVWAQALQTLLLGGWLLVRSAPVVLGVFRAWRASLFAGFMGAAASAGWFTAMAIEPVAHVRTLGLLELLFSLLVSRQVFHERLRPINMAGMALLGLGLVVITLRR